MKRDGEEGRKKDGRGGSLTVINVLLLFITIDIRPVGLGLAILVVDALVVTSKSHRGGSTSSEVYVCYCIKIKINIRSFVFDILTTASVDEAKSE